VQILLKPTVNRFSLLMWSRREGALYLEFASPNTSSTPNQFGNRSYNWQDKITWGMGINEIAAIIAEPNKEHKFYHDPSEYGECKLDLL
jgi:hypothetical protein